MTKHLGAGLAASAFVVAAGTFLAPAGPAAAQATWTCGGINPPGAAITVAAEKFAETVNERLGDKLQIQYFGGSALGSGPAQLEAIAAGAQECYISSTSASSTLLAQWGVVDVPFLFNSMEHYLEFMDSELAQQLNEKMVEEFGVRMISYNWFRLPRVFMGRNDFILEPEDLKDLRVRSPNLPMWLAGWAALGATPVKTNYGEAYLAMSQGLVDGGESAGEQIYSSKFYEVLPYISECEFLYPTNSVVVNDAAFQALDEATQEQLVEIANEAGEYYSELVRSSIDEERAKMKEEGAQFSTCTPEQRAAMAALVEESVPELEAQGLIPEGWWEEIKGMDG